MSKQRLLEDLQEKENRLEALNKKRVDRSISDDESKELRTILDSIDDLKNQIQDQERIDRALAEKMQARAIDKLNVKKDEQKTAERYSVSRAIQLKAAGKKLDGVELEMHEEAAIEARSSNLPISGKGILIPKMIVERADSTTALAAGNLIPTNLQDPVMGYAPKLVLERLGINYHQNLVGNSDIPVGDLTAVASFVAETTDPSPTIDPNIRKVSLTAKGVRSKTKNTWVLQAKAGPMADRMIMGNLMRAEQNLINKVVLNGGGTNEPDGILADSDVTTISIGTNGGPITRDLLIQQLNTPAQNDADMGTLGFVTNPSVREALQKLETDAGSGLFVWNVLSPESLLGYQSLVTTLVPNDLDKGTSTGVCSAIIFGDFNQVHVGVWAVRELIIDPYSDDTAVWTKMVSFWDCAIVNPKSFAVIKDITTS